MHKAAQDFLSYVHIVPDRKPENRISGFSPARKSYRIWLLFTYKNGDFCNGAKLRRADLLRGESHMGLVFTLYLIPGGGGYSLIRA